MANDLVLNRPAQGRKMPLVSKPMRATGTIGFLQGLLTLGESPAARQQ